jgi:hypothetical protein
MLDITDKQRAALLALKGKEFASRSPGRQHHKDLLGMDDDGLLSALGGAQQQYGIMDDIKGKIASIIGGYKERGIGEFLKDISPPGIDLENDLKKAFPNYKSKEKQPSAIKESIKEAGREFVEHNPLKGVLSPTEQQQTEAAEPGAGIANALQTGMRKVVRGLATAGQKQGSLAGYKQPNVAMPVTPAAQPPTAAPPSALTSEPPKGAPAPMIMPPNAAKAAPKTKLGLVTNLSKMLATGQPFAWHETDPATRVGMISELTRMKPTEFASVVRQTLATLTKDMPHYQAVMGILHGAANNHRGYLANPPQFPGVPSPTIAKGALDTGPQSQTEPALTPKRRTQLSGLEPLPLDKQLPIPEGKLVEHSDRPLYGADDVVFGPTITQPQKLIKLLDIDQPDDFGCGACCAMSVGKYFQVGPDKLTDWYKALGTNIKTATSPRRIAEFLAALGLDVVAKNDLTIDDLCRCWAEGKPVICPIQEYGIASKMASFDYGHVVVVIGVALGKVFVYDPSVDNVVAGEDSDEAPGEMMINEDKWLEVWHDVDADNVDYKNYGIIVSTGVKP